MYKTVCGFSLFFMSRVASLGFEQVHGAVIVSVGRLAGWVCLHPLPPLGMRKGWTGHCGPCLLSLCCVGRILFVCFFLIFFKFIEL